MSVIPERKWWLIILRPDCTELAPCGNRWYEVGMSKHRARLAAIESLLQLWELSKKHGDCVALRVSSDDILSQLGGHYIQTWEHGYTGVRIGFVLHNLDRLQPSIRLADKDQIENGLNNAIIKQWGIKR